MRCGQILYTHMRRVFFPASHDDGTVPVNFNIDREDLLGSFCECIPYY